MSKNAAGDARELVGKGDGEHVVMQALLGGLDRAIRVTRVRMRREDRTSISSRSLADLGRYGLPN